MDNRPENKHINYTGMPRLALLFIFLVAGAPAIRASADEWLPTVDVGYVSRNVSRGVERAGSSVETTLGLKHDRFRGEVRLTRPFAGGEPDEVDARVGYAFQPTGRLTIEATARQFLFSDAPAGATKRSTEAGLVATWALREGFAPSLAYHHDFRLRADTVEAALSHETPLTRLGAFLELKLYAGWSRADDVRPDAAGPRIRDGYGYWGAEARLPYRVGEHTTLVAAVRLTGSENQARAWSPIGQGGGLRGGVGLAVSFDF